MKLFKYTIAAACAGALAFTATPASAQEQRCGWKLTCEDIPAVIDQGVGVVNYVCNDLVLGRDCL